MQALSADTSPARPLLRPPTSVALPGATMRPWTAGDAPLMRAALDASESHLRAWTPWVVDGRVPGLSLEERLARHATAFANGDEWVYGIFSPDGREVLGGCGLYARVGPGAVEIGYWLGATHTGRGLATAAARALALIAFESPDVERVEIRCDPANVASARVPERLGFGTDPTERSPEGLMIWRMARADRARLAV